MDTSSGTGFRLEPLNALNWVAWKRRMTAILRELGLLEYVTGSLTEEPVVREATDDLTAITTSDVSAWRERESRARTRLELAIGDSEMSHILGATTAAEIWERLSLVKETKGRLGVLATRRALYRTTVTEDFDLLEHVSNLRGYQSELSLMGSAVTDEDFTMIIVTSLPESWDNFTAAYFGAQVTDSTLRSADLIPILVEESRRRRVRQIEHGSFDSAALQARAQSGGSTGANREVDGGNGSNSARNGGSGGRGRIRECYNCGREGHTMRNCWAPGGGREGEGPGRHHQSNHADGINTAVAVSYIARAQHEAIDDADIPWHLDSGSTYHICHSRALFVDYEAVEDMSVFGLGSTASVVMGIGSVVLEFTGADGIITSRTITGVIHVPYADTCLLSVSRLDVDGFRVEFNGGTCVIKDGDGKIFGLGEVENWLYRLDARAASVSESMAKQEEEFDEGPVTTADWEAVRDGELWL